jgi:hypothetical protein
MKDPYKCEYCNKSLDCDTFSNMEICAENAPAVRGKDRYRITCPNKKCRKENHRYVSSWSKQ